MAKLTRWGVDFHMGILFGLVNQLLLVAFGGAVCADCLGIPDVVDASSGAIDGGSASDALSVLAGAPGMGKSRHGGGQRIAGAGIAGDGRERRCLC